MFATGESATNNSFSHLGILLPYINFHSTPCTIRDSPSQTEEVLARDMEGISLWMQNSPLIRGDCSQRFHLLPSFAKISSLASYLFHIKTKMFPNSSGFDLTF